MTRLEELKAAAWDAYCAGLKKIHEKNPLTILEELKLEKLKAARDAAWDAYEIAVHDALGAVVVVDASYWDAYVAAYGVYEAELKRVQEENSND
jgi:hypothetical protein